MTGLAAQWTWSAGVVLVSAEEVRVCEWRPEGAAELWRAEVQGEPEEARDLRGPAAAYARGGAPEGAHAFRSGQQRDLFERREEEHRVRSVRAAAAQALPFARGHGWELVLVLGDPRLAGAAADELRRAGLRVVERSTVLGGLSDPELHRRAGPELVAERERAQLELLARIRDEALTGGHGALGADDCRTTASAGRIDTLLVDPALDVAEEIASRAHETGARVVLAANGEIAEALREVGGAAALLRW